MRFSKLFAAGLTLPLLSCAHTRHQPTKQLDNINLGSFTPTASYILAQELGLFPSQGLNVSYLLIPNSTFAYNQLLTGGYDVLFGAIDNILNRRFNQNLNLSAVAQIDAGPDYAIYGVPGINTVQDLKGKSLLVDSPVSGFAYLVRKILSLYGLRIESGDYNFTAVGGTPFRYDALVNGTFAGQPTYATLLTWPFSAYANALPSTRRLNILTRVSDLVAPYTSTCVTASGRGLANPVTRDKIVRFTAALLDANRFLASTRRKDKDCARKIIIRFLNVTDAVGAAEYAAITDLVTGEITRGQKGNLTVDQVGTINVINERLEFGAFPNVTAGFDFVEAIKPGPGKVVDDAVLKEAVAIAGKEVKCRA
ncbi:hypothetical protein BDZ85DRAFT_262542 [Elsinoe ampelina]|uniref:SsuA/THI5-like domain-containing protein n=1 Tax=Elsinoe ampelina TaxID=302913 RepID=A0A6A6GAT5_9PEZI|nr:hypothetical protein BDZ85DRAFT_262542 [Elsinoe ampelina]